MLTHRVPTGKVVKPFKTMSYFSLIIKIAIPFLSSKKCGGFSPNQQLYVKCFSIFVFQLEYTAGCIMTWRVYFIWKTRKILLSQPKMIDKQKFLTPLLKPIQERVNELCNSIKSVCCWLFLCQPWLINM